MSETSSSTPTAGGSSSGSGKGWGFKNRSKTRVSSEYKSTTDKDVSPAEDFSEIPRVQEIDSDDDEEEAETKFTKTPELRAGVSAYDQYDKAPAYVAPIPKIPPIIPPVERGKGTSEGVPSANRPQIPRWITERLVGKSIDEYGDVVDDDGKLLGRVAGDLPSMVGRTVLNRRGDVLGDDGELLGYVAEVAPANKGKGRGDDDDDYEDEDEDEEPKSIDQYTGRPSASLQVDHRGNILDSYGNIIGHFRDNLKDPRPPRREEDKAEERREPTPPPPRPKPQKSRAGPGGGEEEEPANAASWRRENESPSDIFLDVKSTTEGIQLTIRIPTVFPNGGTPRINLERV